MEDALLSPIPECSLLEGRHGMSFYALNKTLILSYEPKIKIFSIGKENELDTKNIILMGATGAGKTTIINALVNHLLGVKFECKYRYVLKDETGDSQKNFSDSQTDYVVGYLIYAPKGSGRNHNYMIIDTPGFKDSRGDQRDLEVTQQIKAFLQDVDGLDELHSICFVVNGTIARLQSQFKDVLETFCEIFGENVSKVIRILVSFGHMKKPPVFSVLDNSSLKNYRRIKFDNVSLNDCNIPNEDYSEEEIRVSKSFWDATNRVYESFLNEVDCEDAVCLGITRDTLKSIENLHHSIDCAKEAVSSYLHLMNNFHQMEEESRKQLILIKANENWKGNVTVKVSRRLKPLRQLTKWRTHEDHYEDREVIYEDKKKVHDEARHQEMQIRNQMNQVTECVNQKKQNINDIVSDVINHSIRIQSVSLSNNQNTSSEILEQILREVKMEKLGLVTNSERQEHIVPDLESLNAHLTNFIANINQ